MSELMTNEQDCGSNQVKHFPARLSTVWLPNRTFGSGVDFDEYVHAYKVREYEESAEKYCAELRGENARLHNELIVQLAVVNLVWSALGVETPEQSKGKLLFELVADYKSRAERAEASA